MLRSPSFQRGMSWFELSVVAVLLGVFLLVMTWRLAEYQEIAERADMEYGVTMMKSALRVRLGVLMVEGRMQETSRLMCENPVQWLEKPPANYFGEAQGAMVQQVPAGEWYFDAHECSMGYMVKHSGHFTPDSAGMRRVRYRVRAFKEGEGRPVGLGLELVEPYHWAVQ